VAADFEGRKSLAQPARAGKQIDDAESGWQIRGLSISGCRLYTRSGRRGQEANGGYRRQADPLPDDVRDPGQGHEAGNGAEARVARARLPVSAAWKRCPRSGRIWSSRSHRAVIFVHGCFWHRHEGCRYATTPATRPEFWAEKFAANVRRDRAACEALVADGWRVAIVWECALRRPNQVTATCSALVSWLATGAPNIEIGEGDLRQTE
jgi:hypothetical protein